MLMTQWKLSKTLHQEELFMRVDYWKILQKRCVVISEGKVWDTRFLTGLINQTVKSTQQNPEVWM